MSSIFIARRRGGMRKATGICGENKLWIMNCTEIVKKKWVRAIAGILPRWRYSYIFFFGTPPELRTKRKLGLLILGGRTFPRRSPDRPCRLEKKLYRDRQFRGIEHNIDRQSTDGLSIINQRRGGSVLEKSAPEPDLLFHAGSTRVLFLTPAGATRKMSSVASCRRADKTISPHKR